MHSDRISTEPPFHSDRYEFLRKLGTGGAGSVYLAQDRETGEQLALKMLDRLDQKSVLRFKREFRSLANLHHPNLIRLFDLGRGADAWFFTMEYVQGRNLGDELLQANHVHSTRDQRRLSLNDQGTEAAYFKHVANVFRQLASGVQAVHQAGMLHRDLKPSNVVVSNSGRVVVLDFGLVRQLEVNVEKSGLTVDGTISGTPAYMSPEQATAQPLTEATDWYSFGVMLYEMLRGLLPIDGRNAVDLVQRKLVHDPEPLSDPADGPAPLRELATKLVQRDAAARPNGDEVIAILSQLGEAPVARVRTQSEELIPHTDVITSLSSPPIVGRDRELDQLRAALERTSRQETVIVHIRGSSGVGKSALIERFLQEPRRTGSGDVLTLRSRCYEREAMPFKALDGVMDALVADMLKLDDVEAAHLLPVDSAPLAQLFPVFERLSSVRRLIGRANIGGEAAETRRRAEDALNELIERLAAQRTLVIWIDDLQWGDLDSASVIKSWWTRNTGAPILLIFSYRGEEVETSPCLKALVDSKAATAGVRDVFIDLEPLPEREVRQLCGERLRHAMSTPPKVIDRIVQEAGGNPFLAQQLVALAVAKQARGDSDLDTLSMEELVHRTSALLDPLAQALLHVLAIAGRPLAPHLALMAADIRREGRHHIHALHALRLVRTRVIGGQRCLEVYHDRVREGIQTSLTASEREQQHAQLLRVLELARIADPDWLHELAVGANQRASALRYGVLAAERANASLAFERAAELYTRCLSLNDRPASAADLWVKLAMTLVRCRRGPEAANAYLKAAEHAEPEEQAELWRLAASHLLRSGHFEEGERLVQRVLQALKLEVPTSELGLMAAIGWERARVGIRGYELTARGPSETRTRMRRMAELYGNLSVETQFCDPLRSVLFQARALRMALDASDPATTARTLILAAGMSCVSGTARAARNSAELLQRAEDLARRIDSEDLAIELPCGRALCAMFLGRPPDVIKYSEEAEQAYATRSAIGGHGDYFYMFAVQGTRLTSLFLVGRHIDARDEMRDYLARAQATGNRAAILQVTLTQTLIERTFENCRSSRARLDQERTQLPKGNFGVLQLFHMISVMQAACATGDYEWAHERLAADWPAYLRAPIHGTAFLACNAHFTHARLVLNERVTSDAQGHALRAVQHDLRELERLPASPQRDAYVLRLRARCAYFDGDSQGAIEHLRRSTKAWSEAFSQDEPERDRFAIGCLLGGAEGAQLCAAAEATLRAIGVADPTEDLRGFYPELFHSGLVDKVRSRVEARP